MPAENILIFFFFGDCADRNVSKCLLHVARQFINTRPLHPSACEVRKGSAWQRALTEYKPDPEGNYVASGPAEPSVCFTQAELDLVFEAPAACSVMENGSRKEKKKKLRLS